MATSMSTDTLNLAGSIMHTSSPGIAFDIEVAECIGTPFTVPKRVRRRLEQTPENKSPTSLEDIETKLKDADFRRQQFHEWLVNKARPKRKCDQTGSLLSKDLAERLEAKLYAAEQKRLELLAQEQMRLARLHESRIAAKTEAQLRAEREREELGSKVEFRVQQAETNRMALVEAERQRRAAANERIAQSVLQRSTLEDKDRERAEALRAAICQKIAAAEEKRACLLEAEKSRAQAIVLQARKVAKAVLRERELELMVKKEKLEARLLRAKRQRAEYLRQKGGCRGTCHNHGHRMHKHGDRLCRKLTRCWRQFRRSMKTTYALAQEFAGSGINQQSVTSLPFEQLAGRITSPAALRSVKELLARLESRLKLSVPDSSEIAKIDSLLRRLSPPQRKSSTASGGSRMGKRGSTQAHGKVTTKETARGPGATKVKDAPKHEESNLERYPARVFLCAYMIIGHPDAVFSTKGDREAALAEAASKLLPEFEALVSTVIDGPPSSPSSPPPSPEMTGETHFNEAPHKPFSAQLLSFDSAWHSYLCRFVAWKVKDAQFLEEDLIRVACQLEVSMLQKCKVVPGEDASTLSHDEQAIRKQVLEDQRLLRDRIIHLTGKSGSDKMAEALSAVRSKFLEAKENGVPLPSPFAYSSPEDLKTSPSKIEPDARPRPKAARSLFNSPTSSTSSSLSKTPESISEPVAMDPGADFHNTGITNEQIVNEMLHDAKWKMPEDLTENANEGASTLMKIQAQIRTTIEKAFWDSIEENLMKETPEYGQVVGLVGEIREDLEGIVPEAWKQEVRESLDVELLSQVLESGSNDFGYFRRLLDYTLDMILRLGAPARDTESKSAHQALIDDLSNATPDGATRDSFVKALVKGIRFVFERLQVLKQDISNIRLQSLAQLINGSAGAEYLQKAFAERYTLNPSMSKDQLPLSIPRAVKWILSVQSTMEVQKNEVEAAISTLKSMQVIAPGGQQVNMPPAFPMCTGGRVVVTGPSLSNSAKQKAALSGAEELKMGSIKWGTIEAVVRLGLLTIISGLEPATEDNLPETLLLNVGRTKDCQNDFQRIVVMATGLLLLRQELISKVHGPELENVISEGLKGLASLLNEPKASVVHVGSLLAQVCAKHCAQHYPDVNACAEFMARVLERSLSPGDAVFGRVTAAVRSSLRAILLLGNESDGVSLAESALKRIGGGSLVEDILALARKLDKLSSITVQVHGCWYTRILAESQ